MTHTDAHTFGKYIFFHDRLTSEKEKMTLILLSLTRKSREAAFNCKMDDLEQENGTDTLIDVLDDLFMKELSDSPNMYETRLFSVIRDYQIILEYLIKDSVKVCSPQKKM